MRRLTKMICITLSMMLLVNLTGMEVLAEDLSKSDTMVIGEDGNEDEVIAEDTSETEDEVIAEDASKTDEISEENYVLEEEDLQRETEDTDNELNKIEVKSVDNFKVELDETHTGIKVTLLTEVEGSYKIVVKDSKNEDVGAPTVITKVGSVSIELPNWGEKYNVSLVKVINESSVEQIGNSIPVMLLDTPTIIGSTVDVSSATVSWEKVAGASSYILTNITTGEKVTTTDLSYTFQNLTSGTKYVFGIRASVTVKDEDEDDWPEYSYVSKEATVSVTTQYIKPGKTTGLSGMDGEKCAILTWNKVSGATSYNIYRYNASKKKWDVIKTGVKSTTYTNTKLSEGKKYYYRVAAVNPGGTGALSDKVTVSVKKSPGTNVRTISYKAIVKSRAPIFSSANAKKCVRYLSKGTRIKTIDYCNKRYKFKLSNGKTYWIAKGRLLFTGSIWTTKDYSTKVKTDYINNNGYKSKTNYLIWINQYTQRVMIYYGKKGNWKLIRSCLCATGTHLFKTPRGVFKITYKEKGWFYRTTYEKPVVHFMSGNSFHSRIHNYKGGYADATIGRPKSHGCVRMYDEDVTFIYKKCPVGTTVVSF